MARSYAAFASESMLVKSLARPRSGSSLDGDATSSWRALGSRLQGVLHLQKSTTNKRLLRMIDIAGQARPCMHDEESASLLKFRES